jgi:thymidine kinase
MDEMIAQGNDEPMPHLHTMPGWIEVIAGSMFSGKSEELIRRLRRAKIARQKVQVFKPDIDSRYSQDHIVSHSEMRHESANIRSAEEVLAKVEPDTEVVGIDEGQFFDNGLVEVATQLAGRGVRVIIAGLDQDYTGKPWGTHATTPGYRRIYYKDPRHLHEMRPACELHAAHFRVRRARRRRW